MYLQRTGADVVLIAYSRKERNKVYDLTDAAIFSYGAEVEDADVDHESTMRKLTLSFPNTALLFQFLEKAKQKSGV